MHVIYCVIFGIGYQDFITASIYIKHYVNHLSTFIITCKISMKCSFNWNLITYLNTNLYCNAIYRFTSNIGYINIEIIPSSIEGSYYLDYLRDSQLYTLLSIVYSSQPSVCVDNHLKVAFVLM